MKNYHLIKVKYLGATNTMGSRVKLTSERFNQSKTIPFDYTLNNINDMAAKYLKKTGHKIAGQVESGIICDHIDNKFLALK